MSFENTANKNPLQISNVNPLENDKNDGAIMGQSLIKFMSLATGSVKTALQKPANYKKNINHRRYLQKQLKICTRRKKRTTKTKTGPKTKKGARSETLGTGTEVWFGQANCGEIYMASETNGNQAFSSYNNIFQPYQVSLNGSQVNDYPFQNHSTNMQNGFAWNNFTYSGQEQANALSQQTESNGIFFRDDTLPDMLEPEQFLTGEELTRALDIKDLFVPEQENHTPKYSCTFDENIYNSFQTVPSTTSILSW